jgi:mobilome CxxCx(11)CxxC protein
VILVESVVYNTPPQSEAMMNPTDTNILQACRHLALESFGTAYIFEQRSKKTRNKLKLLTFFGLAGPLATGAVAGSFGLKSPFTSNVLILAGVVAIIQALISLWAIVDHWDNEQAYAVESMVVNHKLAAKFKKLADSAPADIQNQFDVLEAEYRGREESDKKQGVTEEEARMGLRAALRQTQSKCARCGEIPWSMKATNCDVCGKFKMKRGLFR